MSESRVSIVVDTSRAKTAVDDLDKKFKELDDSLDDVDKSSKNAEDGLKSVGDSAKKAGKGVAGLNGDIEKNVEKFDKLKTAFGGLKTAIAGVAGALATAGISMSLREITSQAVEFESAMAGVKKVVDFDSPQAFKQMTDDILELSTVVPISANGLAEIMASAGQAGIAKKELLGFTETAAKMATAFDITAEQAGQAMAEMRVAFKMSQKEVEGLADKINYLGNTTPNTAPKIMEVVQRIGSLGGIAGVSADQIAALAGSITAVEPEVAATGLKNMMLALTAGESASKSTRVAIESLGLSVSDVAKSMQKDSMGTLFKVFEKLKALPKEVQVSTIKDIFGSEALPVVSQLVTNTDMLTTNLQAVGDKSKYAGSMLKEFESMAGTSKNQIQLLNQNMDAVKIALGTALLPALNSIIKSMTPVLKAFAQWANENPKLIATIMAVTTAVIGIAAAVAGVAVILPVLSAGFALLTAPVLGVMAVVAGLIALFMNWDSVVGLVKSGFESFKAKAVEVWSGVVQAVSSAWQSIQSAFSSIGQWFTGIWDSVKTAVVTKFEEIKQAFVTWLSGMPQPVQEMVANIISIFTGIGALAQTAWGLLTTVVQAVADGIVAIWQGLVTILSNVWNGIVSIATSVWNAVKTVVLTVVEAIKPIISGIVAFISMVFQGVVGVATLYFNAIKTVVGVVFEAIKAIISGFFNVAKATIKAGVTVFASIFNMGFNLIKNVFTTAFNVIKALVRGDMEGVKTAIGNGMTNAWNIVKKGVGDIVRAFLTLGSDLYRAGVDAITGFINGITSKVGSAIQTVKNMASSVMTSVKSVLDIHSPSREMKKLGKHTADGFALGIKENADKAKKEAVKMASEAQKAVVDAIADVKRAMALLGKDEIAEIDYEYQNGKYKGASASSINDLKQQTLKSNQLKADYDMQQNIKAVQAEIDTYGMNSVERLRYQLEHSKDYLNVSKEIKEQYIAIVEQQERQKVLAEKMAEFEKAKYLLNHAKDPQAELKYDLQQKGYTEELQKEILMIDEKSRALEKLKAVQESLKPENNQPQTLQSTAVQNYGTGVGGVFAGVAGLLNSVTGSMAKNTQLNKDYQEKQKALQDNLALQNITESEYYAKSEQLLAQHNANKKALMLASGQDALGALTGVMGAMLGEQSSAYKAMYALQKSFAIGEAIMNMWKAGSKAYAETTGTTWQKAAAAAQAVASQGQFVTLIKSLSPTGMAHSGIDNIPKEGTWLLDKGERVLSPRQNADLTQFLQNPTGDNGGGVVVNQTININSDGSASVETDKTQAMAEALKAGILKVIQGEMRQGGSIYRFVKA